ncbi:MAG: hypothetical protein LBT61_04835 [Prevotellaceae bacterium]|jgi:hypothetical protein|nr:hypothetical protein [Prevotellaceae bacterium]
MKNLLIFVVMPALIVILVYFLVSGIAEPVRFEQAREYRYGKIVERLKDIRDVEVAYKSRYGKFTGSFDSLINFYNKGDIKILRQTGSMDDSLAVAQKLIKRDTVTVPVRNNIKLRSINGIFADSLRYVPVVGGEFELRAVMKKVSGLNVPLFEARVSNDVILEGLNRQLVVNINHDIEEINKNLSNVQRYSGLKVGSIDQPNNNAGNWE